MRAVAKGVPTEVSIRMAPGEVFGLKNGDPVMAGVLGGDYKENMAERLLRRSLTLSFI